MKLSRTVVYALRATVQLARKGSGSPVPCSQLAQKGQMPERFLLQILRNLVTHGILSSTRGVDGGYSLSKEPDKISILDIIEAIDGPMDASISFGEDFEQSGAESMSQLKEALEDIASSNRTQLGDIKISHFLPPPKK